MPQRAHTGIVSLSLRPKLPLSMTSRQGHAKYQDKICQGIGTGALTHAHWVYALMCEGEQGGFVKIGYSNNPLKRWKAVLREGKAPAPLKRIAVYSPGTERKGRDLEKALHWQFRDRRVFGEWFRFDFRNAQDKIEFQQGCKLFMRSGWWESFRPELLKQAEAA